MKRYFFRAHNSNDGIIKYIVSSFKSRPLIPISLLVLIILIPIFILSSKYLNPKSEAAWFDEGFAYRKSIPVTNSSGSNLVNQRIKFTLDTAALYTAGKIKINCSDIRITDINGKLLDHWDTACNTASTYIYVKIPSLSLSGTTIYLYYGNPSAISIEKTLGTSDNPGTSCKMMKDQSSVTTNGNYYIVPGGNDADELLVKCNQVDNGGGWALVMNQNAATDGYFTGSVDAQSLNESNPDAGKYSILGKLSKFKDSGIFTFRLNWPGDPNINIWSQTSNPISESIAGYTPISIAQSGVYWGGIAPAGGSTFIDGSPSDGTWYYAIASYAQWSCGIPAYGICATQTQLWVKGNDTMNNVSTGSLGTEEKSLGPVAYWKFDEGVGSTVYDSSPNKINGNVVGATWQSEDQCISGKCLYFNNDDSVSIANSTSLNSNTSTMEMWLKLTDTGAWFGMFRNATGGNQWYFYADNNNTSTFSWFVNSTRYNITVGNPGLNQWHHYAIVIGPNDQYAYQDGKVINHSTVASGLAATDGAIKIGEYGSPGGYNLTGFVDEPKIYSYARTTAQIAADYNAGLARQSSAKGTSVSMSSPSTSNQSNGLLGYWKMDEATAGVGATVYDSSGNNNNGIGSGTTAPAVIAGKFGNGLNINGVNSYVSIAYANPVTSTSAFAWFKRMGSPAGGFHIIFGPSNVEISIPDPGGQIRTGVTTATMGRQVFNSGSGLIDGNWHFLGMVYDGTKLDAYIDGVKTGSLAVSGALSGIAQEIGRYGSNAYVANGYIDEARVYNRALSPKEVTDLYNFSPGPNVYWNFENDTSSTITDKSGTGLNLTISGSPSYETGKFGKALKFDGGGAATSISTSILDTDYHTIGYWLKFNQAAPAYYAKFFTYASGGSDRSPGIWTYLSTNCIHWRYDPSNSGPTACGGPGGEGTSFNINQWYYLTGVKNGNVFNFYVDGKLIESGAVSSPKVSGSSAITLGGGSPYVSMDEVKIYNYARTQGQIISDMNGGHPVGGSPVGSQMGYWKMDEGYGTVVNDAGVNKLDMTLGTGSSSPIWSNNGKYGKALFFDGNDYISKTDTTSSPLDVTNITLSAWIYPTVVDGLERMIFEKSYGTGWEFSVDRSGLKVNANHGGVYESSFMNTNGNGIIVANRWHYVAWTYDGLVTKLYLNGNVVQTLNKTGDLAVNNGNLYLGSRGASYGFFQGIIDEAKIYNTALTDEEIKIDYNRGQAMQMGTLSSGAGNTAPSNAASQEYCVPGDSAVCSPPVAEWKFEQGVGSTVAYDTSGKGNNGIFGVGSSAPTWTSGKVGKALKFDGNDSVTTGTTNFPTGSSDRTLESWFRTSANLATNTWGGIFSFGSINSAQAYIIAVSSSTDSDCGTNNSFSVSQWGDAVCGTTSVNDGKWHHGVVTSSGNTYNIYVDGVWQKTGTMTTNTVLNISNIGNAMGSNYLNGNIDEVKMYNYVRTPAQIAWDYNRGAPVAWWKLDECQGNAAHDSSGNRLDGAINIGVGGSQASVGTCTTASTAWGNGATGKYNSSLSFDGTDDRVDINSNKLMGPDGITMSAWIRTNSAKSWNFIMGKGNMSSGNPLTKVLGMDLYNSRLNFIISQGDNTGWCYQPSAGPLLPTDGTWHHVVGTFNRTTSSIKTYVDGILKYDGNNDCNQTGDSEGSNTFYIGQDSTLWPNGYYSGQIDDTKIFNYVLNSTQIKTLFNNGALNFAPVAGSP